MTRSRVSDDLVSSPSATVSADHDLGRPSGREAEDGRYHSATSRVARRRRLVLAESVLSIVVALATPLFGAVLLVTFVLTALSQPVVGQEWPAYGGDPGGSQFTALDDITRENVDSLEPLWTFRTGHLDREIRDHGKVTFEVTPILFQERLVLIDPWNVVFALDPGTGKELWRFDAEIESRAHWSEVKARGVASWSSEDPDESTCAHRILFGTLDARLIALDAESGKPCADFGEDGTVDLSPDVNFGSRADYQVTSPPAIIGDLVVVGSAIGDNRHVEVERGTVRAFDVRTGELQWSFDPIPRALDADGQPADPKAAATWKAGRERTGGANAWAPISADLERGLVFIPTGSAAPDFYGGERPGANLYANSVVALEAATGDVRWHFQIVHHDLWDFDVPAQPTLATLPARGDHGPRDVVVQGTKQGFLFVLDRDTGQPMHPVEERPAPKSDIAGEWTAETQPVPTLPAPLTPYGNDAVEPWGPTASDREACAKLFAPLRRDGLFTPPSLEGSLLLPGNGGWHELGRRCSASRARHRCCCEQSHADSRAAP